MRKSAPALLLALAVAAAACAEDPVDSSRVDTSCPAGQRRVYFQLDGAAVMTRCVELDTLVAAPSPTCTVAVWTSPQNRRHDESFRYEASAADTDTPCGTAYFFAVMQNSSGGYTYFDGVVRRSFDAGSGPFATGAYEVLNGQQTLVGIGHFEFWE